jgi:hypothetical protein
MAKVPYSPVQSVLPTGAPSDFEHVQATPSMFGAEIGQAERQTGSDLSQASNELFQQGMARQQISNELMANDASTEYMKKATALYGQFANNEGKNAVAALPQFQSDLQDLWKSQMDGLPNNQTKAMMDRGTRFYVNRFYSMAQNHADTQLTRWSDQSSIDRADTFGNQAALSVNNPQDMDNQIELGAREIEALADHRGMDQDATNDLVTKYKGVTIRKIADSLVAAGRPQDALDITNRYSQQIDSGSRLEILNKLHPIMLDMRANQDVDTILNKGQSVLDVQGNQPPPALPQIKNAIHMQESGGKPYDYQIQPATFAQYAKPGESFDNPIDHEAVADRIFQDYYQKYSGDPARMAVAYFSGPQNVAPPGAPTPYLRDVEDKNGKSTSSYVGDILHQLGSSGARAQFLLDKSGTLAQIENDPKYRDDPQLGARVRQIVEQRLTTQSIAQMAADKARLAAQEAAADGHFKAITALINDPNALQTEIGKINGDPALNYNLRKSLVDAAEAHLSRGIQHETETYGNGFWQAYQDIHRPAGDPRRITDPTQLYTRVGPNGDLTLSGVDKLTSEITARRSPEGESESLMKKQFLENARHQISGTEEGLHFKDPKGDELYLKFLAQALPAYDAAKAGGKSAAQLLDPDSPDYLGRNIATFKRPMAQWMNDMMTTQDPGGENVDTSPEGLRKLYQTDPVRAKSLAIKMGYIRPDDPNQPTPPEGR